MCREEGVYVVGMVLAYYVAVLITTTKSLQQLMLDDFLSELNELSILLRGSPSLQERERATNRKSVVEESIVELQKQVLDPTRHHTITEGGYTDEELLRFEATRQASIDQGQTHRPPPADICRRISTLVGKQPINI